MTIRAFGRLLPLGILVAALPPQSNSAATSVFGADKVPQGTTKYNYIVELRANSDTVCGGIAVGDRWVLTAAHCAPLAQRVRPFDASQEALISKRYCHPKYVRTTESRLNAEYDLALLKTQEPIGGSWQRKSVAVPNANNLIVFGWGKTSLLGFVINTSLRKSKPMILKDSSECTNYWNSDQIVDGNEFCAGATTSSACPGDSGGPVFNVVSVGSELEPKELVGILSKADNACDEHGIYDIYTAIDSEWIEKIVDGDVSERDLSTCPSGE